MPGPKNPWSPRQTIIWWIDEAKPHRKLAIVQMIVWRALQGFLGAGMIPTVFASAYTVFPRSKFYIVGPIIGLVATLAPTVGPTVARVITDWKARPWLFLIHILPGTRLPPGVVALAT